MPAWRGGSNVLAFLLLITLATASLADTAGECRQLWEEHVNNRLSSVTPVPGSEAKRTVFLHVPRTAGSTFLSCFLRHTSNPERRCPNIYVDPETLHDVIQNMDPPDCEVVSSHFDASVMNFLPEPHIPTAIITQLRDPVARAISMYEYSVESGSRMAAWRRSSKSHPTESGNKMTVIANTVWPWNYLIPFMADDIEKRLANEAPLEEGWVAVENEKGQKWFVNKAKNESKWVLSEEEKEDMLPPLDPYNHDLAMSLSEFVRHPVAHELVHNGQAHLVLGISNITMWDRDKMSALRVCADTDLGLLKDMIAMSRKLMRQYRHVGSSDALDTTVETAAVAFNWSMLDLAWNPSPEASDGNANLGMPLGEAYRTCSIQMSVHASGERSVDTLGRKDGRKVVFGSKAKRSIPVEVIDYIRDHNLMDIQLHAEASRLLEAQRQAFQAAQLLVPLPVYNETYQQSLKAHAKETQRKRWSNMWHRSKEEEEEEEKRGEEEGIAAGGEAASSGAAKEHDSTKEGGHGNDEL